MGSIWLNDVCHYCGKKAGSVDHIVPRMILPRPLVLLPQWYRNMNEIPACVPCNNNKRNTRGTCYCKSCVASWITAKNCRFIRELEDWEIETLIAVDEFYIDYLGSQ